MNAKMQLGIFQRYFVGILPRVDMFFPGYGFSTVAVGLQHIQHSDYYSYSAQPNARCDMVAR
jgi:hypothetical protein